MKSARLCCYSFLYLALSVHPVAGQTTTPEIVKAATPAVVVIHVATDDGGRQGSGFIVSPDGRIVTNYHVIEAASAARIHLSNGEVYEDVQVEGIDEKRDIALLRVPGFGLPTIPLSNSDSVSVGSEIIAIGSPRGLDNSVSTGVVSGRRQLQGYSLLQISAAVSPGSSGGPILDTQGQAIGVAVASLSDGQNLNFAVPINYVRGLLATSTEVIATLAPLADGAAHAERTTVNSGIPLDLSGTSNLTIRTETDLEGGYKRKDEISYRIYEVAPDSSHVEILVAGEIEYKQDIFSNAVTVQKYELRDVAVARGLVPITSLGATQSWDGRAWQSYGWNFRFADGKATGVIESAGERAEIEQELPHGIVLDAFAGAVIRQVAADSLSGRTLPLATYTPQQNEVSRGQFRFGEIDEMKEAGIEFRVIEVEVIRGTTRQTLYYSLHHPRITVRGEGADEKWKVKKVTEP